ncbi:hypothetical protein AB0337_003003 [Klebsiella variicola]|uniref:hypothetical protein n=1 Tax=Klebsiella pneumoniae TaxID=573 RepID=UPI0033762C3F
MVEFYCTPVLLQKIGIASKKIPERLIGLDRLGRILTGKSALAASKITFAITGNFGMVFCKI